MNKNYLLLALASAVWLAGSVPALGVDKGIQGKKILVKDHPVDPDGNRFNFLSKDPNIVFGANADSDTPTIHGASVLLFNPTTSECQCIVLPAAGWQLGASGFRYVYRDPSVAVTPIKFVRIKGGDLKIVARGAGLTGVTLDETTQGELAVHYTSGNGSRLCAHFNASSSIRIDQPGSFYALVAPAPGACLPEPAGCTPCVPPIVP